MNTESKETSIETTPAAATSSILSIDSLVGMAKATAKTAAEAAGYVVRVVKEDEETFMSTMEVNSKRVNFSILKGVIEKVKIG